MKMQHTMYGSSNMKHMWLLYRLEICLGNKYLKKFAVYSFIDNNHINVELRIMVTQPSNIGVLDQYSLNFLKIQ